METLKNKFFALLFLMLFTISFASALEPLEFDNVKEIVSLDKIDYYIIGDKNISYNSLWDVYPNVEVKNGFGIDIPFIYQGATLYQMSLTEHEENCRGDTCTSIYDTYTSGEYALVDDVAFKTLQEDESWIEQDVRSYQFYYADISNAEQKLVNDYESVCTLGKEICTIIPANLSNNTLESTSCYTPQSCEQVKIGEHYEDKVIWNEYTLGDKYPEGNYKVKLMAEIMPGRTVDWVIFSHSNWFEEFATWTRWQGMPDVYNDTVAYYPMNETADSVRDVSMTGHEGLVDNAFNFDGSKDYILSDISKTFTTFSTSFWINWDNIGTTDVNMIMEGDIEGNLLIHTGGGAGTNGIRFGLEGTTSYLDVSNILTSGWNHITITYDDTTAKIYKNGTIFDTSTINWGSPVLTTLSIGKRTTGSNPFYYDGKLDEIAIWDDDITSTDVTSLYNSGAGKSYSDLTSGEKTNLVSYYSLDEVGSDPLDSHGSNDGELSGGTNNGATRGATGIIENAFDFDGTNDYVDVTGFSTSSSFSASMWLNIDAQGITTYILDAQTGRIILGEHGTSTSNYLGYYDSSSWHSSSILYSNLIGSWNHVLLVVDGTNAKIYVNNTKVLDTTCVSSTIGGNIVIGADHSGAAQFVDGLIDEVAIFDRALNDSEITEIYNAGAGLPYEAGEEPFTVTLNSPADDSITSNQTILFNVSAEVSSAINITNMTLYTNETGSWASRNVTTGINNSTHTQTWTRTISPGTYIWNTEVCDSDDTCNWATANYTFTIDIAPPVFNLVNVTTPIIYNYGDNISIDFNVSDDGLDDCWYNYNASNTTFSCASNVEQEINITSVQSYTNITFYANDTINNVNSTVVSFTYDTIPPSINITSPVTAYNFLFNNQTLDLNWTVNDTNLDSCWYIYNGSSQNVSCSVNTTQFQYVANVNNITFYANDTLGNEDNLTQSWTIKVIEVSQVYNNETVEGKTEDFYAYITLGTGVDLSTATLNYNGVSLPSSITSSGQQRTLSVEDYQIPDYAIDTNVSFYWELTLDDATDINLAEKIQLVLAVGLDNCSVNTFGLLNISLYDEDDKTPLIGDIEVLYNVLNKPGYAQVNEMSTEILGVDNTLVCSSANLTDANLAYSLEIRYVADDYAPEFYHIQRADIDGSIDTINLYDLSLNQSTEFKIIYQDDSYNFVSDAIIQLNRKYISEGSSETVEAPLTSNDGVAVVHIDLDTNKYSATVLKNGVVLDTFDNIVFKCTNELSGDCEQELLGSIDPQNQIQYEKIVDFSYTIPNINETDNMITLSFTIPSNVPGLVNIVMEQRDQFGNQTLCNKSVTSSSGSIFCQFDKTIGDSYVDLWIYKNGDPITYKTYKIDESNDVDWLDNNYIIVIVIILSLVGMSWNSPEWVVGMSVVGLLISGMIWLVNGLDFAVGLGILMNLVIAAGIIILKISKQEDR